MKFTNATKFDRKSGGTKWSDGFRFPVSNAYLESVLFIRSTLTCLRQVAKGINSIDRQLLPPPRPMRALLSPLSFRAKPRNLQFA
jgi:hypothetical protein